MRSNKRWIAIALVAIMLLTLVPAVQAEEGQGQSAFRNLAAGLGYEWSEAPEAKYPDDHNKLTDGIYGKLDMSDPAWVGHVRKMTREVVFDLGEKKSISNIKARFLQDWPTNTMLVPLTVSMYVSDDKENWGTLSHNSTKLLWGDGPPRDEVYDWDGSRDGIKSGNSDAEIAYARYVKVTFSMHTRAWTFIDEIEIWGADGKVEGAEEVAAEQPSYLEPGEATGGIRHLGLLYNGQYANDKGTWTKDRIIPNISYVDLAGEPVDWLFDGVLYLGLTSPAGNAFGGGATLADWKWYLDKTFAETGDMQQLNEAAMEVGGKLNQPDHKVKVVLMIPDPGEYVNDFGDIDGDGVSESFNASEVGELKAYANREKAIQWWLNEAEQKWASKNYSHLELAGMYWLEEQISTSATGPDLIRSTSNKVHDQNLKLFWIPHFLAYKSHMWKDVGIDAVTFQPNYFFEELDEDRLEDATNIAKQYGMGVELEFDDRMVTDGVFRERFVDYLNSGVQTGFMQAGFKAYYQGNNAVFDTAVSSDPATRILYDWLYQFVNGTYQTNNAAPPKAEVQMNGQILQSGAVVLEREPVSFTWKLIDDDGSGLNKVTATFNGKPYTEGTVINLAGKPGKHELVITVSAGKSEKTAYVIEAGTNASDLKTLIESYKETKQITNDEAARSLNNYLEMMNRFEGSDEAKFTKYLKGFNAKLDLLKKDHIITDGAYSTLKEDVYYLLGNLAMNKAAEASTVEASSPNYAAGKAVDGFPATRWASELLDKTWFQIDLGEVTEMDTIRIDWEYARAKTYKLLVSDDKQNWTNAVKENNGVITAVDGKETVHFDPIKARYIKFEGIDRATFYGYSFYEFGVYHLSGAEPVKSIEGIKTTVDAASKKVTLDGLVMNGDLANVSLKVIDPQGKVHNEAQTTGTEAGNFQFAFTLTGELEGTYEAYLSLDDMSEPEKITFEYKKEIEVIKTIEGVKAGLDTATKKVTIDGLVVNGDQANVSLKVLDPQGKVHYTAETTSGDAGNFQFAFTLTGELEGIYEAYLSLDDIGEPKKITFEYKKEIEVIKTIEGVKAGLDAATKKVTIDGLVVNGDHSKVSLKVLDPQGKVHYTAETTSGDAGNFQFAFTLTGELEGIYEAYLSLDDMSEPKKINFEYKKETTGGGGGESPVISTPDLFQLQSDGSVKAEINAKLDPNGTMAVGVVSEQDLKKAIARAKADKDGKLKAAIVLKKSGEAAKYAVDLPTAFLSEYPNLLIEVISPKATVLLSGQMLVKSAELGKDIRFVMGERDKKSLSQDVQAQVGERTIVELSVLMDGKPYTWTNAKAPITVTVPYLLADHETASKIGMLFINDQGTASVIAGAAYSASDKHIRFQTDRTGTYAVFYKQPAVPFTDLGKYSWAQEAVEKLAALGIVKGTSNTTFSPAEQVSRADFILMLVRALGLKTEASGAFTDVQPQDYYYDAVAIAKKLGIVTGMEGERFAPKAKITRQDMMVMAARALKAAGAAEITGDIKALDSFKDADKVTDYAASSIAGMIEQGLIQGDGGMIKPRNHTTRAETAVFLYRLLNFLSDKG
ncbi:DUF4855 domain-containing protein [Bacillus sp. FJAT-28004]|uniref:DUF4855 domain-containing protein n=1 Tax=Bacillus sp. FJAT-28004 TaxID=1679165 RepID=UPI0006B5192F|nr:DUF4855 domain-containing protein [Bacillus sp. FJAT-28004]